MSELRWDPFKELRDKLQQRTQQPDDDETDSVTPDHDQGKQTDEPPTPPDMNDIIRAAAGVRMPRDRRGHRIPEIGD